LPQQLLPQNQKEPVQNDPKKKESQFKKTEIRKKEIIQNEIQTRLKKKQKIGGDKIQIGDAQKKRTMDRKWLTNNRYPQRRGGSGSVRPKPATGSTRRRRRRGLRAPTCLQWRGGCHYL
jgi:hypothetical protein